MIRFNQAFRDEFRSNWPFLLIGFSALFFGFSAPAYALPFLYPEVIEEFGWSREQATLLASAKYLTGAVACLVAGRLLDVIGVWITLLISITIGALACLGFMLVDGLPSYYVVGVMLGVAGPGAMVSVFVLVARTFRASQGTATGVTLLGTGLGGVVMPIATEALIAEHGWRLAMAFLSLGIWLIALPLLIYGLLKLRIADENEHRADNAPGALGALAHLRKLAEGRDFWFMALAFFIITIADQGFTQHQVLMLNDAGISTEMAALAIGAIGLLSMPGRIVAGGVLDRSSTKGLAMLYGNLAMAAILALMLGNMIALLAFIVLRAMAHASVMIDGPVIARHTYGTRHLGVLLGLFTAMANLGSATGPWVMGRMFDANHSYDNSLYLFIGLSLLSALLIWHVRPFAWAREHATPVSSPEEATA